MKGFKPVIKMASGGLVPKMPKPPALPKTATKLSGPRGPTGPKAANQKGMKPMKPQAVGFKKGGHVDEKEDVALIKQYVKSSALKGGDKRFGK